MIYLNKVERYQIISYAIGVILASLLFGSLTLKLTTNEYLSIGIGMLAGTITFTIMICATKINLH